MTNKPSICFFVGHFLIKYVYVLIFEYIVIYIYIYNDN